MDWDRGDDGQVGGGGCGWLVVEMELDGLRI